MTKSYSNYEWFLQNDLEEYSGKWLAIINKKVVEVNKDIQQLIDIVKEKYPNEKPLITKVRSKLSIL